MSIASLLELIVARGLLQGRTPIPWAQDIGLAMNSQKRHCFSNYKLQLFRANIA